MRLVEMSGWRVLSLINERGVRDYRRRAAAMTFLRHVLSESKEPQTGIYFWIPTSKGWRLETFFDSQFPSQRGYDLDHATIWRKWVSTMLRIDDPAKTRGIAHNYAGLPRGRITKSMPRKGGIAKYLILHGDDSPIKNAAKTIAARFNLPPGSWVWEYDDHERMLDDDVRIIKRFLQKV